MKVWKYPILIFLCFPFSNALISTCHILLQSSELLPLGSYPHSSTTAQLLFVESAIIINLFLFLSLEISAFNDVESGSCSSEMFPMMSWRSPILSELNLSCCLWPCCVKVSAWIFRLFLSWFIVFAFSNLILDFLEPWVKMTKKEI